MLPRFLHNSLLTTPPVALHTVRLEIGRLGEAVSEMVAAIMPAAIRGTRDELEAIAAMDKVVDALHIAIIDFLGKISSTTLTARQSRELMQLIEVTNNLEHIGDLIATSMVASARKRIDEDVSVSELTARILADYHAFVVSALNDALRAVTQQDAETAKAVSRRKKSFSELSHRLAQHGLGRLMAQEPNRLRTYAREMDVIEILGGVFTVARRIARSQLKLAKEESVPA
jgi:phosphate:Na+ symporter